MHVWIVLVTLVIVPFIDGPAFPAGPPDELKIPVLQQEAVDRLAAVRSDEEAKAFFLTYFREALGLKAVMPNKRVGPPSKTKSAPPQSPTSEWVAMGVGLTRALATRQLAAQLIEAANSHDAAKLQAILDRARSQYEWLAADRARPDLHRAVALATVASAVPQTPGPLPSSSIREPYAAYLDRTYPSFAGSDGSWLDVAEREGSTGVRRQLMAFWENGSTPQSDVSDVEKQALAAHYFHTRLQPVLLAHVIASAVRADAGAEQQARSHWLNLTTWPEKMREAQGLVRLCGTWQWTIHNHQHHQEQKIAMVFPPPDAGGFPGPRPAKAVVLGDAIYLRWEFPGSVQEDSLLFTGEGQRLEGSFVNSSGAWGSITAKRMTPCSG